MSVIGITLNDVIRDYIGQLKYVYLKYYSDKLTPKEIAEWDDLEVSDFNLKEFFKFNSDEKLYQFLYVEAPMEIYGHADQMYNNLANSLNFFIANIIDEEEHEIVIISRDANKSRPSTLFFLAKLGFIGNNIRFVDDTKKKWDGIDILITANPIALSNKPEGKTSVKIKTSYNKDVDADFVFDSILDLINNDENFNKIVNK